jgi:hypothetical protein
MPGLWYYDTHPISFTLVVDDFGIIASLKTMYTLTEDWTRDLYCGIALDWDYVNRTVDISMPGCIKKKTQEYGHLVPSQRQTCPYSPEPKKIGSDAQAPLPPNDMPRLDENGIKVLEPLVCCLKGIWVHPYILIPAKLAPDFGIWVTCGLKMMPLRHG